MTMDTPATAWTQLPERPLVYLDPSQILFKDRAREVYDDLDQLVKSIQEKGVIQALAVRATEDPDIYELLAGGRRFSAALLARLRPLPCQVFPAEIDELGRKEIELYENLHRQALTWQETSRLTKKIHRLMEQKYGVAVGGGVAGSKLGHSQADTAVMLGKDRTTVTKDLLRAEALEKHPELEKVSTAYDADRLLKKIQRDRAAAAAARKFEASPAASTDEGVAKQLLVRSYLVGDFFQLVQDLPDNSFHLVEIDPPYSIDLVGIKNAHFSELEGYEEVGKDQYSGFMLDLMQHCSRILAPNGWIICWGAFQWLHMIKQTIQQQGLQIGNVPGFWTRPHPKGQTLQPLYNLASCIEPFLYARKPEATIQRQGRLNQFDYAYVSPSQKIHPTERPIELIQELLSTFAPPNSSIFVPFLGSGNTLLAANNAKMRGLGCDLDKDGIYRNGFVKRVQDGTLGKFTSYQTET